MWRHFDQVENEYFTNYWGQITIDGDETFPTNMFEKYLSAP